MVVIEPHLELFSRLARRLHGRDASVLRLDALTGGASKQTYSLVVNAGSAHAYIVQLWQPPPEQSAEPDILPRVAPLEDAAIQRLVSGGGALVPAIVHVLDEEDALGAGYVSVQIPGETLGRRLVAHDSLRNARELLGEQLAASLAATHRARLDVASQLVPELSISALIARFRDLLDVWGHANPPLEWALCWLEDHRPMVQRRALCHGDFRIGNFIVGDDGLRAVLDWELSSIGDPAQDLGWLCVRSWRFAGKGACGGFTSREAFLAAYLAQGGVPITLADVLYWEAFGNVRWALHCVRRGLRQGDAGFTIEDAAVGRRLAEPLHDFFDLVTTYGP